MMKEYLMLCLILLWKSALSLKPGSNIYPNEYCQRDGQYLPHPHSPCRYLRCGRLPSGLDIDDDLRKVLFSAEYRCPLGYAVRSEVFRKARNGHISDICIAKDPRCLQEDLDIPGATHPPHTVHQRKPEAQKPDRYNQMLVRSKGHNPANRKYSSDGFSQRAASQNALLQQHNNIGPSASPKHGTIKFGRGSHRVADDLVIPRQIAQLHPWLVQNESSVPYVAGPPMPVRPHTTALPLTTTEEPSQPRYVHRRKLRRHYRGHHKNRNNGKNTVHPLPLYPPGYKPKQDTSDIQSDYSSSFDGTTARTNDVSNYPTKSPLNHDSRQKLQAKRQKRPVFKYWPHKKLNNPEKYTYSAKDSDAESTGTLKKSGQLRETGFKPSPTHVTPKVSYDHLYRRNKKKFINHNTKESSVSLPGAYTKFNPEPLNYNQLPESNENAPKSSHRTKQLDVVDYGTYSNSGRATPWPLSVGLDDDINSYLPGDDEQKSTGMYIPEETLATLDLTTPEQNGNSKDVGDEHEEESQVHFDNADEINKDNIDTGEDSPMFPVPVVVRGDNKRTGNPLSLSNLPRGYYVLMPLKKTEKIPVLPKVSLSESKM